MSSKRTTMGRIEFVRRLKNTYPLLFDSDADGVNIIKGYDSVPDFIMAHHILPTTKSFTSYRDVWDYICANEDKHTWWLL
ncbi:hypothetical protein KAU11_08585 [Candidatus Babeliales bacterium]|nr:hypothetical protein [Candidatus Babeliales bacterium]